VGNEYRRTDGAEERNGELFLGLRRMRKKVVVGMTVRRKMKGNTIQEKEKEIITNRDEWAAEINYFAHRLYRAMILFLVYIYIYIDIYIYIFIYIRDNCVLCRRIHQGHEIIKIF